MGPPVTLAATDLGIEDRRQNRPPGSDATAAGRSNELSGDDDARRTRVAAPARGRAERAPDRARDGRGSKDGGPVPGGGAEARAVHRDGDRRGRRAGRAAGADAASSG